MGHLWVGRRRPWHEILLISLASSLLYEGCNKSSQTKTCANSTPDLHFLLATGQLVLDWQTVLLCSIVNTTILHSTVTSAPKHGKVLKVDRQIWRKGQFFSRAMVDFSQLGHCHIWHHLVAGVAIVMPFWGWWWWLKPRYDHFYMVVATRSGMVHLMEAGLILMQPQWFIWFSGLWHVDKSKLSHLVFISSRAN